MKYRIILENNLKQVKIRKFPTILVNIKTQFLKHNLILIVYFKIIRLNQAEIRLTKILLIYKKGFK